MEKQINVFNKNLERYHAFDIKQDRIDSGANGVVIYGSMCERDNIENKNTVALKTYKDNSKTAFDNEKTFFKDIEELKIDFDGIVKCYGTAHINEKEYIVMENLKERGFIAIAKLYIAMTSLHKTRANQINIAVAKLEEIKEHLSTNQIIHGDIKDDNVMINLSNGNVKLIDFGSSKIIKNKGELTKIEQDALKKDATDLDKIICQFDIKYFQPKAFKPKNKTLPSK